MAIRARKIIKSYNQMAENFDRNLEDKVYIAMHEDIINAEKALNSGEYKILKDSMDKLRSNFEQITFMSSVKELKCN